MVTSVYLSCLLLEWTNYLMTLYLGRNGMSLVAVLLEPAGGLVHTIGAFMLMYCYIIDVRTALISYTCVALLYLTILLTGV